MRYLQVFVDKIMDLKSNRSDHYMANANEVIWIGCDHGGYELKEHVLKFLEGRSVAFHDVGCHSTGIVRYPYFAAQVPSDCPR